MVDDRLVRRVRSVRVLLGVDVALALLATATLLVQALLVATIVADAFDRVPAGSVGVLLAVLVATVAARALLSGSTETVGRWAAGRVMSELRRALVRQRVGTGSAAAPGDVVETGELATAAVAGVDALEVYFSRYLPQVVLAVTVPVAVLATTLALDPTSAAVMLLTLPVIPLFMALVGRYSGERSRARWLALSRLSNHVLDVVRGLPTLRAYNRAEAQAELIAASSERYRLTTMQVLRVSFLSGAVLDLAATIGTALVAVTVGVRMAAGGVDLRTGLAVLLLTPELYAPLRALGTLFHASADGRAAAERILEVLGPEAATPERATDGDDPAGQGGGRAQPVGWQRIRLTGVTVEQPGRPAAPRDVDLDLRRGEVVALVGPSGAGKSTVAALLLGLRQADRGRITVDSRDLGTLDLTWWRGQIGWLPQRPTMFRGTIHDNIAVADPSASLQQIEAAGRLAGVDDVVSELRLGYRTVIGPGGRQLSAGEQRRVALARALVRDAPLLILDEPTAHLDRASVAVVADAIARVARHRAVLVIEHRPGLVPAVDRIVALRAPGEPGRFEPRAAPEPTSVAGEPAVTVP